MRESPQRATVDDLKPHALHDGPRPDWPAKAAALAELARQQIPVPPAIVLPLAVETLDDEEVAAAARSLLSAGPVIARAALAGEDEAEQSAAGLGTSIAGLVDLEGLRAAVSQIVAARSETWLQGVLRGPSPHDVVIVQREIAARWTVVAALLPDGLDYVEVHAGSTTALGAGSSPLFAGLLDGWGDDDRDPLRASLAQLRARVPLGTHGLDVELVIDERSDVWVVQARPLVTDLLAGWDSFRAELQRRGQLEQLEGVLVLDAEHNPAPLSWAHAWLMQWLAEQRPAAGRPVVLAGWLYVHTLPRDLQPSDDRVEHDTGEVLLHLRDVLVPEGRARLRELDDALAGADRSRTAALLDDALACFLWMIDRYLGVLIPARARARRAAPPDVLSLHPEDPLSTRGRDAFVDVLPVAWDIASPSLAEVGWERAPEHRDDALEIPADPAAQAALLAEWDDHLFALGLAPLRRLWLHAGRLMALDTDVFLMGGDELRATLLGRFDRDDPRFAERRDALRRASELRPPLRIEHGLPVPTLPTARMRGIGIGESVTGRVASRRDLEHLSSDPPAPDCIVVIPALTAQAAVVLRDLGVRAVCCAHGGALSHATLMARELGLSALVGCRGCLDVPDGASVHLDTRLGRLLRVR